MLFKKHSTTAVGLEHRATAIRVQKTERERRCLSLSQTTLQRHYPQNLAALTPTDLVPLRVELAA